ncbi:cysteine-rich secretory protein [Paragonimus westermani]|uniref:Cysteine-rich secretory protein n=1 Tax=Paragonimus westermani TaxID=34504 RepID=A0A5J4N4Q3_9TREM|nr:cysteine-rich secretory protein [Paragonimus westermani]
MKIGCMLISSLMLVVLTSQQNEREAFRQWRKGILAEHNEYRKMARKGKIPGHPAASKMPVLRWDKKLTADAKKWSERCGVGHDYSTEDGENLAYNTDKLASVVQPWFMEYKHYTFGRLPERSPEVITHYTQVNCLGKYNQTGLFPTLLSTLYYLEENSQKRILHCLSLFTQVSKSVRTLLMLSGLNHLDQMLSRDLNYRGNWIGELPYNPK